MVISWRQKLKLSCILLLGLVLLPSYALSENVQFADEAVKLCSAWLMTPSQFDDVLAAQGYTAGASSADGDTWKSRAYSKSPSRKFSTVEIPTGKAITRMCNFNTSETFSGSELDVFVAALSENTVLGPFVSKLGTQQLGNIASRYALLQSKSSSFSVSIGSTNSMTEFNFTKVVSNKAN